jgi:hypothetical protein
MLLAEPDVFTVMAHDWAVKYAGAPQQAHLNTARFSSLARVPPRREDERQYVPCDDFGCWKTYEERLTRNAS